MSNVTFKSLTKLLATLGALCLLNACGMADEDDKDDSKKGAGFKLYLTDAPNQDMSSVYVNIKHFEVWLEGHGKEARLVVGEDTGLVNLLILQYGLLPIANLDLPDNLRINKFRIILEDQGHYAVKKDGSVCELRTPGSNSGLKVNLTSALDVSQGKSISVVLDFDAKKSVVSLGNGDCLLKPVLRLQSAIEHTFDDDLNWAIGEMPIENDLLGNDQPTNEGDPDADDGNGFDPAPPSTWPVGITPKDLVQYFR